MAKIDLTLFPDRLEEYNKTRTGTKYHHSNFRSDEESCLGAGNHQA